MTQSAFSSACLTSLHKKWKIMVYTHMLGYLLQKLNLTFLMLVIWHWSLMGLLCLHCTTSADMSLEADTKYYQSGDQLCIWMQYLITELQIWHTMFRIISLWTHASICCILRETSSSRFTSTVYYTILTTYSLDATIMNCDSSPTIQVFSLV